MLPQDENPQPGITLPQAPVSEAPVSEAPAPAAPAPSITQPQMPPYGIIPPQTPAPAAPESRETANRNGAIVGAILLLIGIVILAANLAQSDILGLLVLPLLGIIFLVAAFIGRISGLAIPGSILTGLGLGTLAQQTWLVSAAGETRGGVVVIGLALGFLAIMPLLQILENHFYWWPAIPGGILLVVGIALWAGPAGTSFLLLIGTLWPLALIAVGAYLLWRVYRQPRGPTHGVPS